MSRRNQVRIPNPKTLGVPGGMNKTEHEYSNYLTMLKDHDVLLAWKFEPIKLRLADRTFYTPDFAVVRPSGELEFHEVKGFMRDDAAVKIKMAHELFGNWFRFFLVRRGRGATWNVTEIGNKTED